MRVLVLGGTRFIGRAIVEELAAAGHELAVVHRGEREPPNGFPDAAHIHVERGHLRAKRDEIAAFRADAAVDTFAMTRAGAEVALDVVPEGIPTVVLSSMDVYRAFGALNSGLVTDSVPIDEASPVRADRYMYRGKMPGAAWADEYEKLDVEELVLPRGATVLRLPMVFGEGDGQRREEFILRRVRAGRGRIPIGSGSWLSARGYVRDIARGARLCLERPERVRGEILNLCERRTAPVVLWATQILHAAGSEAELVRVPEDLLPEDMGETATIAQHLMVDSTKARELVGYTDTEPLEAVRRSVAWHLANPPERDDPGFDADDRALAAATA